VKRLRRVHPLYYVALMLFVVALGVTAVTSTSVGPARSASVYDQGPGGAGALRKFFDAMGISTVTAQGDTFRVDGNDVAVLFILGPSEAVTPADAAEVRRFVAAGGTAVIATDAGLFDRPLLDLFDVHVAGALGPGEYPIGSIAFSDPPASRISLDRGVTLTLGPGRVPLAAAEGRAFVAIAPEGRGALVVIGAIGPFLNDQLGSAENGRFALALASAAYATGRSVAFDEYHHGYHPTDDALVLLERTWPGRALVLAAVAIFVYLVLTGRHLGLPIPLDPRPPRSSLEFIRGFAGLVRRSGHEEIARARFRKELRTGLARELALDPATPFDRTLTAIAATDPRRAEAARRLDAALDRPLRDDAILRTVHEIGTVLGGAREAGR
jgi:hypothetical protein